MQIVGIKFKKDGIAYNFCSEMELKVGDKVVVETEKGLHLGEVARINIKLDKIDNLKEVIRTASEDDYNTYLNNLSDAKTVLEEAKKEVQKRNLEMNLIDANFSLDRRQLLFNFLADERIDFRELVRALASKYHARIELHQIGIRDKAKEIGGIGICGQKLCCANCIRTFNPVNINMVKNQNIALNPSKINGVCGRLLCCFNYENEVYEENRTKLPKIGDKVGYKGKQCEVVDINILKLKYKIKIDENTIEEVDINDRM